MTRITTSTLARGLAAAVATLAVAAPAALAAKPDHATGRPADVAKPKQAAKPEHVATPSTSVAAGGACAERAFSTVFASYQDSSLYTLAPDGDFEAGAAGWTLADGATVADESSSLQLGAALGAKSLELAPGASATTPAICVEHGFPGFRFAARSAGASRGVLRVQVLYGSGHKSKKTGRIKAAHAWKVTRKLSLAQGRFHVKAGQSANVQLKFTASRGTVRMDDVYVDPRLRR
jgi:hypothetical protein